MAEQLHDDFEGLPPLNDPVATDGQTEKTGDIFDTTTERGRIMQRNLDQAFRDLPVYHFTKEQMKSILDNVRSRVEEEQIENNN
jgi:hypothetical protein